MELLPVILTIALLGFCAWLIIQIPMPQVFRNLIIGLICLFIVIWVLQTLGVVTGLPRLRLK